MIDIVEMIMNYDCIPSEDEHTWGNGQGEWCTLYNLVYTGFFGYGSSEIFGLGDGRGYTQYYEYGAGYGTGNGTGSDVFTGIRLGFGENHIEKKPFGLIFIPKR